MTAGGGSSDNRGTPARAAEPSPDGLPHRPDPTPRTSRQARAARRA
ncbi:MULTISPECIES: hypothetical protein [unclassified Streptomyces]|nr:MULTISPECIES: hypothetical protein [unclassified Streptomyces]